MQSKQQSSFKRDDALVLPIVKDPVEGGRVPAEAGTRMIPAPCDPSETEKNAT